MKKNTSLMIFLLLVLFSAGVALYFFFPGGWSKCGNPSEFAPSLSGEAHLPWSGNLSETSKENAEALPFSGISLQDLVDLGLTQENASQYLLANLPLCSHPELQVIEPLEMNKLVKNCSTKEKKGKIPDGLGWACFWRKTYDAPGKRILSMDECATGLDPQFVLEHTESRPLFICKETNNEVIGRLLSETVKNWNNAQAGESSFALEKALSDWLLTIALPDIYNTSSLYCKEQDPDCENTYDVGSRSDEFWNYFVVGTRENPYEKSLYAVNGKLYDPGEAHGEYPSGISTPDQSRESAWLFGGVKDKTMIVKKLKNYRATGETLSGGLFASTFTLETCEIDL